jgi:hypothetical protein
MDRTGFMLEFFIKPDSIIMEPAESVLKVLIFFLNVDQNDKNSSYQTEGQSYAR